MMKNAVSNGEGSTEGGQLFNIILGAQERAMEGSSARIEDATSQGGQVENMVMSSVRSLHRSPPSLSSGIEGTDPIGRGLPRRYPARAG